VDSRVIVHIRSVSREDQILLHLFRDNDYPSPAAVANPDGTTTVYFSPAKPAGAKDGNWIQTVSGKGFNVMLRLYSPLEPFFTKQWRPSEVEKVK
jgi:hypothetical protein